jgi:hypothetical protein
MGGTLKRRQKAGALHKSVIVFFVLNASILESVRPVDHDVEDGTSTKAEQKSSFVEVGTNHLALANMSRKARRDMEDRSDVGWGRRRKEEQEKEQNAEAEGDGAQEKKKGGWGRRRRSEDEQKEQNAQQQQVEWQDMDGNIDEDDVAGQEINGVKGTPENRARSQQNGALPDEALRDVQGSGEEVPLQEDEVRHRHGGLGDNTFSTVNGVLGSKALDILGEENDAPPDYDPKVAPLNDQGVPVQTGDPFFVNEREPELTHMNASLDTIHNDTEVEGVKTHKPFDLTSFGKRPKRGPGAATSRNHFRETLALRPRIHSAVGVLQANLGKIRTSARNFNTELDNSLIPLHQIHEKVKDVNTIADSLKGGLREDSKQIARDVANPLDAFHEKGVYGESKGNKFAPDAGQWNVFAPMLACHKKCLPESEEECIKDCLGKKHDFVLEDQLGIERPPSEDQHEPWANGQGSASI